MFNKLAGAAWGVLSGFSASILPGVGSQTATQYAQLAGVLGQDAQVSATITSLITSQLLNSVKEVVNPGASGSVVSLNKVGLFQGLNKKHLIKNLIKAKVFALLGGIAFGLMCGSLLISLKSSVALSGFLALMVLIKNRESWLKLLIFFGAVHGWFALSSLVGIIAPVPALASAVFFIPSLLSQKNLNKNADDSSGACPRIQVSPISLVINALTHFLSPGLSNAQESEEDSLNNVVSISATEAFMEGMALPLMAMGDVGSKTSAQILISELGNAELLLTLSAVLISFPLLGQVIKTYESIPQSLIKPIGLLINSAVLFSSAGLMWGVVALLVGLALNKMELPSHLLSMMYFGAVL